MLETTPRRLDAAGSSRACSNFSRLGSAAAHGKPAGVEMAVAARCEGQEAVSANLDMAPRRQGLRAERQRGRGDSQRQGENPRQQERRCACHDRSPVRMRSQDARLRSLVAQAGGRFADQSRIRPECDGDHARWAIASIPACPRFVQFAGDMCGTDFSAYIRKQYEEYGRVIREANIKVE